MWLKIVLWLLAAMNVLFGAAALFFPDKVASWVNFGLLNDAARGEIRAVYGGLVSALGVMIALAMFRPAGREWLLALSLGFVGLVVGRLVSLILEGPVSYTLVAGAFEALAAAALIYASRNLS